MTRLHRCRPPPARPRAAPGETLAAAMQLAIALLTAGLDSAELEAWAVDELIPVDADGLADFMAGLHVISVVLLNELHEATGEPPAAILQRLAIQAERRRGRRPPARAMPPARHGHRWLAPRASDRQAFAVNSRHLLSVLVDEPGSGLPIKTGQARPDDGDDERAGRCGAREGAG